MRSRKQSRFRKSVEVDLEILPLMNLFVVLIPMMLLSAVFLEVTVVRMDLPVDGAGDGSSAETLDLSVRIEDGRYLIHGNSLAETEVLRAGDGDRDALTEALRVVAEAHPSNKSVRIVSRPATHYEEIIRVMDASREAGMPLVSLQGTGD
jgi:biopolymer transport protein ExbD